MTVGLSWLSVALTPSFDVDVGYNLRRILVIAAASSLVLALCLLWSKARGWGPVLRILYGVPWLVSAGLCAIWWLATNQKVSDLMSSDDTASRAVAGLGDLGQTLGIARLEPAPGLYLWSAAVVLGFVGLLVPGTLYEVRVRRR